MIDKTLRTGWQLLVRVEIDKSRRVQCQCRGCGKTVYADVHLVQWPDGEIACWGSRCFEREMGIVGKELQAVYSRVNGRKLTDAERDLLDANREALIAQRRFAEAIGPLKRAVQLIPPPHNREAWKSLGECYRLRGDEELADMIELFSEQDNPPEAVPNIMQILNITLMLEQAVDDQQADDFDWGEHDDLDE